MSRKRTPHRQQQQQRKEISNSSEAYNSGLVVARHGAKIDVEDENGTIYRCTSRRKFGAIVCGDRVSWQASHDNEGIVIDVLPRQTLLVRPDDVGREKPIAANISQIVIVCTVKALTNNNYNLNANLIDRYLVAAEQLDITPVIVINKIDLLNEDDIKQLNLEIQSYLDIGYQVSHSSTKLSHGLEQLRQQLQNQTNVLVGESGVGKSSIIGALLSDVDIRVGEVSKASGKGKHTTTTTTLYHLNGGGDLIDSPGVREFGLSRIEPEELAFDFIEFRQYNHQCKFHNCIHNAEPQCAVKQAVADGRINQRRYQSYLEILESLQNKD